MTIDTDLFVVVGLVLAAISLPSAIAAYIEERFPFVALGVMALGASLLGLGVYAAPSDYSLARVPHSFVEILARIIN